MNVGEKAYMALVAMANANNPQEDGDYYDAEGFLMCGKCHTRKQQLVPKPKSMGDGNITVGCRCKCSEEKKRIDDAAEEHEKFLQDLKIRRDIGLVDLPLKECNFERADSANAKALNACKDYIADWNNMRAHNIGMMLYGGVGTGKTFLAQCMANAMIEKHIMAGVTSFPKILNVIQNTPDADRRTLIKSLGWFELLIIDDLGAERDTSYGTEQIFMVVDERLRSGKPVIVTTNLSPQEFENPKDMSYRRIYDRILEMCAKRIPVVGESRRKFIAKERLAAALKNDRGEKQ